MKIQKNLEPIISGISAAIVIGVLAFLTLRTPAGIWLMFSFGATVFIVFVLHKSEAAQPKNVFFGHLISIIIGVTINEIVGFSFFSMGIAVGLSIILMIYCKVIHPPAASNPLIAIFSDVSFEYIFFPVIFGSLLIILFSILINKILLKRKYPNRKIF